MKRRMIFWSIAVAGLLLCAESAQAQSRVVRRTRTETRDDRRVQREEPGRARRVEPVIPQPRPAKIVENEVIRAFERERHDSDRLRMADMVFSTGGLMTVAQVTRVSESFNYDSNRVKFLKKAYQFCVDRYNYYMVLGTLDYSSSREKIIEFVLDNRTEDIRNGEPVRKISSSDMNTIIKVLKNESYDSTRGKLANMIASGSILTSRQIADMAKTFSYDSNRYKFLLYAYESCVDPENYVIAVNTLEFSSNRNELMRKIGRRP